MGRVSSCFSASSRPFLPDIGFPFKRCRAKISPSIQRAYPTTPPIIDSAPAALCFCKVSSRAAWKVGTTQKKMILSPRLSTSLTTESICTRLKQGQAVCA
ncbi:hypothetical protein VNO80_30639 [Phaseolus coccineus]|uniref:Uncharacterized protein n=1 Tax=Phaseolus coccineus TaxID=3886 RepID=A0AAN9QFZ8_PHACN